ncbi:MAG: hypothetical protein ACK5IB_04850 [Qingshengfaniella sp.]
MRLEFSLPRDERILDTVLDAILRAHPWEHPVINVSEQREL